MYVISGICRSTAMYGRFAGEQHTSILFHDCLLKCATCDAVDALSCEPRCVDYDDVLVEVDKMECMNISLSGGEPLLDFSSAMAMVSNLCNEGYAVDVETGGAVNLFRGAFKRPDGMTYTMGLKCPSSKSVNGVQFANLLELTEQDYLKIVPQDERDLLWAGTVLAENPTDATVHVLLGECVGYDRLRDISNDFGWNTWDVRGHCGDDTC